MRANHIPDTCLQQYYMANTLYGRGKSRQKTVPITFWGQHKKRERDYCIPDEVTGENACCEAPGMWQPQ